MKSHVASLARTGAILICIGSFFAIAAPGDGQTAMIMYPAWLAGGIIGLTALRMLCTSSAARSQWPLVGGLATVALLSVAWSFYVCFLYSREGERSHAETKDGTNVPLR